MTEQVKQDVEEKSVQTLEKTGKKPLKRRSQEDKVGRQKYHEVLTKKSLALQERILAELRWQRRMLDRIGGAVYTEKDMEGFAVRDEVDREIIQRVREAGSPGVLPKDVAVAPALKLFSLKYYEVSRRIVRMNKRLHFETGKLLFEKRGHRWALTHWFVFDADGATAEDLEGDRAGFSRGAEAVSEEEVGE